MIINADNPYKFQICNDLLNPHVYLFSISSTQKRTELKGLIQLFSQIPKRPMDF